MTCEHWHEALSALADGERAEADVALIDAHLARCPDCRTYDAASRELRRRSAVRAARPMPDLSARVVKLDRIADRARWRIVRAALVVVALTIIGLFLPALILGQEGSASTHTARHLGAFSLTYGVALLVVAVRPSRARIMLPVALTLAVALIITAVIDIVGGHTPAAREARHIPELVSLALLWLLALPSPRRHGRAEPDSDTLGPVMRVVQNGQNAENGQSRRQAL